MFNRETTKIFTAVLLFLFICNTAIIVDTQEFDMPSSAIPAAVDYYAGADLYYLEKDGRRMPLVLYKYSLIIVLQQSKF